MSSYLEKAGTPKAKTDLKNKQQTVSLKQRVLKRELEITGIISLVVVFAYMLGDPLAVKCISVSYQVGNVNQYDKGYNDCYFVAFWAVTFAFLRAAFMKFLFHPTAQSLNIEPFSKRERFAEQGWSLTYYTLYWSYGMVDTRVNYIMYNGPHWLNTSYYWIDYPHILISRQTKTYYLMQLAFWVQQVYTIHIEKRRKDHFAMVTHHFITILLIASSYFTNFTRIGNAVLCCMDLSDIILSVSGMLAIYPASNEFQACQIIEVHWLIQDM
ncbi:hypothetical protein INT47_005924 [Mucor saturninus]|uniref:TLC domain-containing protein n=1 Tax=Mucor saturninus TaxID=64648 RepID=A0A8H7R6Z1_9FUNG|nr:hypothetical protein INT47_005924 [Mucor saturninus]